MKKESSRDIRTILNKYSLGRHCVTFIVVQSNPDDSERNSSSSKVTRTTVRRKKLKLLL